VQGAVGPARARFVAGSMQQAVRAPLIAFMAAISQAQAEVAKAARRYGASASSPLGFASIC
jgi:hypothetical protein